jgi:integrase
MAHQKAMREKFFKLGLAQSPHLELSFTGLLGARLDVHNFEQRFLAQLCQKARVPKTTSLHATRHTFATVLLAAGEKLRYVSEQMGHKDESTTERRYKHWIVDERFDGDRRGLHQAAWGLKKGQG